MNIYNKINRQQREDIYINRKEYFLRVIKPMLERRGINPNDVLLLKEKILQMTQGTINLTLKAVAKNSETEGKVKNFTIP